MKIRRDINGIAILETKKDRINFTIICIGLLISTIVVTATFAWLPYWLVTGKNIYKEMIES